MPSTGRGANLRLQLDGGNKLAIAGNKKVPLLGRAKEPQKFQRLAVEDVFVGHTGIKRTEKAGVGGSIPPCPTLKVNGLDVSPRRSKSRWWLYGGSLTRSATSRECVSDSNTLERGREATCEESPGLDMPDVVYQTVDGLRVTLTERWWLMHILPRHAEIPEVDVAQALTAAEHVYQHRADPTRRVYQGPPLATGFFRGLIPTVVAGPAAAPPASPRDGPLPNTTVQPGAP